LGCIAIAVGGIISARQYDKARDVRKQWEAPFEWVLLAWGLLWWSGAVEREIERFVAPHFYIAAIVISVAMTSSVMASLARRWNWPALMHATVPTLPLLGLMALAAYSTYYEMGPLPNLGWLAWPAALTASYVLLWRFELIWPTPLGRTWHAGTAWLLVFLLTWTCASTAYLLLPDSAVWGGSMWAIVPSIAVLALGRYGRLVSWPVERFERLYATVVPLAPVVFIALWTVWACSQSGDAAPLPYVPVVNPLEIAQALGLITIYVWWTRVPDVEAFGAPMAPVVRPAVALMTFLALNALVGRVVHFYLDVPYDLDALPESAAFQAGLSVLWALTALSVMTLARRSAERNVWFVGAGLLGLLTLKLFLIDLGNIGGVARIVSFLVTGVLILVIGYFSPVPPKPQEATS
jgi:uncharacterized membrane protein